jgi:hypothetical protein
MHKAIFGFMENWYDKTHHFKLKIDSELIFND